MLIRFHKGIYVDAVVPTTVGGTLSAAPGDVVWELPADINPSKTIQVTENVQATDPVTGALLFNPDGSPEWATTPVLDTNGDPVLGPDGEPETRILTQQVSKTVTLLSNPTEFTPADIAAASSYVVDGSVEQARSKQTAVVMAAYAAALAQGFTSSATGTTRTYGFAQTDQDNMDQVDQDVQDGITTFPYSEYADIHGALVTFSTAAQWKQLITDATNFKTTNIGKLRTARTSIATAETPADVYAVSF